MKASIALASVFFSSFALAGQDVTYQVDGQDYEGYFSKAKTDSAPLVILLHDWDGLTEYEKKRSEMLVELGYDVFAADLFGKGIRPTEVKDKKQHTGELYKDRNKMRKLLMSAVNTAEQQGANINNMVAAGYCFGGAAVLEMARSGAQAKGFVTFHGGLTTPEGQDYQQTKAPIVVFHGSADHMIPMSQFADLTEQLEAAKVSHEMITYSGAPHAFTVYGSKNYQQAADEKSWSRFTQVLSQVTAQP